MWMVPALAPPLIRTNPIWVRADNTLMSLISATLTEPILATVIGCTSSADMWSILDEYFSQHSNANRADYKTKLANLKRGSRSVSEYLSEAKSLSDALAAIGDPVPDEELVQTGLRGLGSDYDLIVTPIELLPTLPKFSALRAHLLKFEARSTAASQAD